MSSRPLRTGEVAAQAGVSIATLRYYERRGLIRPPERTPSGYRAFPTETVGLVRLIKEAQRLGFTLREIHHLLDLQAAPTASCRDFYVAAHAKLADLEKRIESLRQSRRSLEHLLSLCPQEDDRAARDCPIADRLCKAEPGVRRA